MIGRVCKCMRACVFVYMSGSWCEVGVNFACECGISEWNICIVIKSDDFNFHLVKHYQHSPTTPLPFSSKIKLLKLYTLHLQCYARSCAGLHIGFDHMDVFRLHRSASMCTPTCRDRNMHIYICTCIHT